jgi:integrase
MKGHPLNSTRQRYQKGNLRKAERKTGFVWEYRYRDHSQPGSPMRQLTLSTTKYPTKAEAETALQYQLLKINGAESYVARNEPTFNVVIDRFIREERLVEIMAQRPGEVTILDGLAYSTAAVYSSFLSRHIRPRWGNTPLSRIRPLEVMEWLKTLKLSPKSKAHLKRMLHLLFERAMLWGLVEVTRNPLELVRVKGGSKRQKQPTVLTPEEFQALVHELPEPYSIMATLAMCTGLRISEVLALRWEHINFSAGTMLVQQGAVSGRIGRTKTEASRDEMPLDDDFARILLDWKAKNNDSNVGLVFPSPVTGGCFHAGIIMRRHIKPAGERLGIKDVGWHSFRHSYRGMLDDTGANTGTQQKLMRHANVSTTMDFYGRSSMKAKQEANSKVVQMVLAKIPNVGFCGVGDLAKSG